jgi:hypothetical protein
MRVGCDLAVVWLRFALCTLRWLCLRWCVYFGSNIYMCACVLYCAQLMSSLETSMPVFCKFQSSCLRKPACRVTCYIATLPPTATRPPAQPPSCPSYVLPDQLPSATHVIRPPVRPPVIRPSTGPSASPSHSHYRPVSPVSQIVVKTT